MPYRLFALSNFASLIALLGFPVLFEPWLTLPQLGWAWSLLYGVFVLFCAVTAWLSLRAGHLGEAIELQRQQTVSGVAPTLSMQLRWLALAAMGSVMLLAVTNHVTQNVASVPFLWVLPLSLYLLTFVLAFDHPRLYQRSAFIAAVAVAVPAMAWLIPSLNLKLAASVFFVGLFVACMFCHGELARLRPDPRHLTRFYLMLSLGGALGAVLVAIVAPLTLHGYFEVNIALVLLALLVLLQLGGWKRLIGLAVVAVTAYFSIEGALDYSRGLRVMERDFYGVVRTRDSAEPVPYRAMLHGGIIHGGQLLGDAYRNTPSDYFGPGSGYGRLFTALNETRPGPRRVGIIGLGAGVVASYGRPGDTFTFYEISPRVVDVARSEFTFLRDTPAKTEVVLGDGRLSLEREAPRRYDVLGIDAFSGDSIPMHLVTREAMAKYVRHLAPDGVIVFQATNRYIDLLPIVKRLAAEVGMETVVVSDAPLIGGVEARGQSLPARTQAQLQPSHACIVYVEVLIIGRVAVDILDLEGCGVIKEILVEGNQFDGAVGAEAMAHSHFVGHRCGRFEIGIAEELKRGLCAAAQFGEYVGIFGALRKMTVGQKENVPFGDGVRNSQARRNMSLAAIAQEVEGVVLEIVARGVGQRYAIGIGHGALNVFAREPTVEAQARPDSILVRSNVSLGKPPWTEKGRLDALTGIDKP